MLTFFAAALCALHVVAWLIVPDRSKPQSETSAPAMSLESASA
jgi:phage shock protein PspC (stress-responsive transcriptional regulator)